MHTYISCNFHQIFGFKLWFRFTIVDIGNSSRDILWVGFYWKCKNDDVKRWMDDFFLQVYYTRLSFGVLQRMGNLLFPEIFGIQRCLLAFILKFYRICSYKLGVLGLLLFLNFFSLKTTVSRFQIACTIAKILSISIIIVTGFYLLIFKGSRTYNKSLAFNLHFEARQRICKLLSLQTQLLTLVILQTHSLPGFFRRFLTSVIITNLDIQIWWLGHCKSTKILFNSPNL